MQKIIMLGTGCGGTVSLYNTCFVMKNEKGIFLVDAGGSVEITKRLKQVGIKLDELTDIFISHSHTDHLLGLIWLFKKMNGIIMHGKIDHKINIYCNDVVYEAIKGVSGYVLPRELVDAVFNYINFNILNDGDKYEINGVTYEFFDIKAKGTKQFGFECMLEGSRFVFLGDETLNKDLYDRVRNADYVTHEAFCLDKEENIFHAYEKNHSTALSAAKVLNELNVKNIILYHTEESHGLERKQLYTEEAQKAFKRTVIVPNDLETIDLSSIDKVGGIILKDKKILVQRKKNNREECIIPGGKRENNETDLETLKRELKEEMNVEVVKTEFLGGYDDRAVFSNKPIHIQAYITEIKGKIKCDNEIKETLWIDKNYKNEGIKLGSILEDYIIPELIRRGLM